MKYFKIGDKIYGENYLEKNSDLLLFGDMPKDAFLRRILNCYGVDLYYNLEDKKIIIKDLENNCILDNNPDSPLWNSTNAAISLAFDEEHLLNINIKRTSGIDISLKFDLVNSIDWVKHKIPKNNEYNLDYDNDKLIEFKYSKYGKCEFKNNLSDYSFQYNTEDLNTNQTKSITLNITSLTNQNRINYNLKNGELSTIYCYSRNNNLIKRNNLIPIEEFNNLFNEDLDPLTSVINNDLNDLTHLVSISKLEYLQTHKKSLSNKIKNIYKQIRAAYENITKIKKELYKIDDEIFALTSTNTNNDIKEKRYAKK